MSQKHHSVKKTWINILLSPYSVPFQNHEICNTFSGIWKYSTKDFQEVIRAENW